MDAAKAIAEIEVWEMTLRSVVTFATLLLLTRIMGKKQLSQLSYFHYITGITIGSIAGEISVQTDTHFINGMISLLWWFVLTILISYILLKWTNARKMFDDEPTIVIKEGKILEKSLKSLRLHLDDLMMLLREQSVFSLKDVDWAVMENNGKLSILKKTDQLGTTKQDVKAPITEPKYFPTHLISEGKIVQKNLTELNLTEEWVMKKLRKKNIHDVKDVFFAQIQTDGSLFIDLKEKEEESN